MKEKILEHLNLFEQERNVKVLYACESGSRAWGFASKDSDWDIRFIYIHPLSWYLSIQVNPKDTIERQLKDPDLDFSGWELKKAIGLFKKGNPHMLEYLRSPEVYIEPHFPIEQLQWNIERFFSAKASIHHYLHMAYGNFNRYLQADEVSLKKYLYVLRPVLACNWIARKEGPPPVRFETLLDEFIPTSTLRTHIDILLENKKQGYELGSGPRIDVLNDFLGRELTYWDTYAKELRTPVSKGEKQERRNILDSMLKNSVLNYDKEF